MSEDILEKDLKAEKDNQQAYEEEGCANRQEYLQQLADDSGVDSEIVSALADLLGPGEDFDGLVSELEDIEGMF